MKKIPLINTYFFSILTLIFFGCSKINLGKTETIVEKVKKIWVVLAATEDGTNVYTQGGNSNIKLNYSKFVLNLSNPPSVTLTEIDGLSYTGTYEIVGETKLILKNLVPVPSGTNGTIEFTIKKIDDSQFEITRTTANPKTGATTNTYILTVKS